MKINIEGSEGKDFQPGSTVGDILDTFGIKEKCIGAKVNGTVVDFFHNVEEDSEIEPVKNGSEEGLQLIRHTAAHVMAEAVQSLFPEARVTIGPVIQNGFYYDYDFPRGFNPEDLEKIEQKMGEIIKENKPLTRKIITRDKAIELFSKNGENYKVEI
ncbi:MAG: threonine--tRNA ligase, partial [Nitrospinota bacterium]